MILRGGGCGSSTQKDSSIVSAPNLDNQKIPPQLVNQIKFHSTRIAQNASLILDQQQNLMNSFQFFSLNARAVWLLVKQQNYTKQAIDLVQESLEQLFPAFKSFLQSNLQFALYTSQIITQLAWVMFKFYSTNKDRFLELSKQQQYLNEIDQISERLEIEADSSRYQNHIEYEIFVLQAIIFITPTNSTEGQDILVKFLGGSFKAIASFSLNDDLIDSLKDGVAYLYQQGIKYCRLKKLELIYSLLTLKFDSMDQLERKEETKKIVDQLGKVFKEIIRESNDWEIWFTWIQLLSELYCFKPILEQIVIDKSMYEQIKQKEYTIPILNNKHAIALRQQHIQTDLISKNLFDTSSILQEQALLQTIILQGQGLLLNYEQQYFAKLQIQRDSQKDLENQMPITTAKISQMLNRIKQAQDQLLEFYLLINQEDLTDQSKLKQAEKILKNQQNIIIKLLSEIENIKCLLKLVEVLIENVEEKHEIQEEYYQIQQLSCDQYLNGLIKSKSNEYQETFNRDHFIGVIDKLFLQSINSKAYQQQLQAFKQNQQDQSLIKSLIDSIKKLQFDQGKSKTLTLDSLIGLNNAIILILDQIVSLNWNLELSIILQAKLKIVSAQQQQFDKSSLMYQQLVQQGNQMIPYEPLHQSVKFLYTQYTQCESNQKFKKIELQVVNQLEKILKNLLVEKLDSMNRVSQFMIKNVFKQINQPEDVKFDLEILKMIEINMQDQILYLNQVQSSIKMISDFLLYEKESNVDNRDDVQLLIDQTTLTEIRQIFQKNQMNHFQMSLCLQKLNSYNESYNVVFINYENILKAKDNNFFMQVSEKKHFLDQLLFYFQALTSLNILNKTDQEVANKLQMDVDKKLQQLIDMQIAKPSTFNIETNNKIQNEIEFYQNLYNLLEEIRQKQQIQLNKINQFQSTCNEILLQVENLKTERKLSQYLPEYAELLNQTESHIKELMAKLNVDNLNLIVENDPILTLLQNRQNYQYKKEIQSQIIFILSQIDTKEEESSFIGEKIDDIKSQLMDILSQNKWRIRQVIIYELQQMRLFSLSQQSINFSSGLLVKFQVYETDKRIKVLFDTQKRDSSILVSKYWASQEQQIQNKIKDKLKELNDVAQQLSIENDPTLKNQIKKEYARLENEVQGILENVQNIGNSLGITVLFFQDLKQDLLRIESQIQQLTEMMEDINKDIKYLKGRSVKELLEIRMQRVLQQRLVQNSDNVYIQIQTKENHSEQNFEDSETVLITEDLFGDGEINEFIWKQQKDSLLILSLVKKRLKNFKTVKNLRINYKILRFLQKINSQLINILKDKCIFLNISNHHPNIFKLKINLQKTLKIEKQQITLKRKLTKQNLLLLIHGQAGSGKSTAARKIEEFLWIVYQKNKNQQDYIPLIPIFVSLPQLKDPIYCAIEETLRSDNYRFNERQVEEFKEAVELKQYRLIIIMDSYDELKQQYIGLNLNCSNRISKWRWYQDKNKYPKVITTSRSELFTINGYNTWFFSESNQIKYYKEVRLLKFTDSQIQQYIEEYTQLCVKRVIKDFYFTAYQEQNYKEFDDFYNDLTKQVGLANIKQEKPQMLNSDKISVILQKCKQFVSNEHLKSMQQMLMEIWSSWQYQNFIKLLSLESVIETPFMLEIVMAVLPYIVKQRQEINNIKENFIKKYIYLSKKNDQIQKQALDEWQSILNNQQFITEFVQEFQINQQEKKIVQYFKHHQKLNIIKQALLQEPLSTYDFYVEFFEHYFKRQINKLRESGEQIDYDSIGNELWEFAHRLANEMTFRNLSQVQFQPSGLIFKKKYIDWQDKFFNDDEKEGVYKRLFRKCIPIKQKNGIYSFNHKSLQEFLVAKWFIEHLNEMLQSKNQNDKNPIDKNVDDKNKNDKNPNEKNQIEKSANDKNQNEKNAQDKNLNKKNANDKIINEKNQNDKKTNDKNQNDMNVKEKMTPSEMEEKDELFQYNFFQKSWDLDYMQGPIRFIIDKIKFNDEMKQKLMDLVYFSQNDSKYLVASSNSFYILNLLGYSFIEKDFQEIKIQGISLNNANFFKCDFSKSEFKNVKLSRVNLNQSIISDVKWQEIQIDELPRIQSKLNSIDQITYLKSKEVIIVTDGTQIQTFNLSKLQEDTTIKFEFKPKLIVQSNNEKFLALMNNSQILLYDIEKNESKKINYENVFSCYKQCITFSPDDKSLILGGSDGADQIQIQKVFQDEEITQKSQNNNSNKKGGSNIQQNQGSTIQRNEAQKKTMEQVGVTLSQNFVSSLISEYVVAIKCAKVVVLQHYSDTFSIYNPEDSKIETHESRINKITCTDINTDSTSIAVGGYKGEINIFYINQIDTLFGLEGHKDEISQLKFSKDGKQLVSCSHDKTIRLWNTQQQLQISQTQFYLKPKVLSLSLLNDTSLVLTGFTEGLIQLWDLESSDSRLDMGKGHSLQITCAIFTFDGKFIISGSYDKTIKIWRTKTGQQEGPNLTKHTQPITALAISEESTLLCSGSLDGYIYLWDFQNLKFQGEIKHYGAGIEDIKIILHKEEYRILSQTNEQIAQLWINSYQEYYLLYDYEEENKDQRKILGYECKEVLNQSKNLPVDVGRSYNITYYFLRDQKITAIESSYDNQSKLIGTDKGVLLIIYLNESSQQRTTSSKKPIEIIKSINQKYFLTITEQKIHIWRYSDYILNQTLISGEQKIKDVFVFNNNIYCGGTSIEIWNVHQQTKLQKRLPQPDTVQSIGYNQEQNLIYLGLKNGSVKVYDITYNQEQIFIAHEGEIKKISWLNSKKMLLTAGNDRKLKLWTNQNQFFKEEGVDNPIQTFFVSLDETYFILQQSNMLCIWNLDNLEQVECMVNIDQNTKVLAVFSSQQVFWANDFQMQVLPIMNKKIKYSLMQKKRSHFPQAIATTDKMILTADYQGHIFFWNFDGEKISQITDSRNEFRSMNLSSDYTKLILGFKNLLIVINLNTKQPIFTKQIPETPLITACFLNNTKIIAATESKNAQTLIFNIENENQQPTIINEHVGYALGIKVHILSQTYLTFGDDKAIRYYVKCDQQYSCKYSYSSVLKFECQGAIVQDGIITSKSKIQLKDLFEQKLANLVQKK